MPKNEMVQRIIKESIDNYNATGNTRLNVAHLSQVLGVSTPYLRMSILGMRGWRVERWLEVLSALDCVRVEDGKITITANLREHEMRRIQKIAEIDYRR